VRASASPGGTSCSGPKNDRSSSRVWGDGRLPAARSDASLRAAPDAGADMTAGEEGHLRGLYGAAKWDAMTAQERAGAVERHRIRLRAGDSR